MSHGYTDLPPASHEANKHGCYKTPRSPSAAPIHTGKCESPGTLIAVAELLLKVTACFSKTFRLMRNIIPRGSFSLIFAANIKIQK